jgi:hypothetical protein
MEAAADIIKDALSEITVLGAEAPVEAADAQAGIRYLNRMMAALDADGIALGYTKVSSLGNNVTIPDGAYEPVVAMLAARLWRQFADDAPIPNDLVLRAMQGKSTLRALSVTVGPTEYPSTLPIGSGNEGYSAGRVSHFYPDLESEILAETNGVIGLEDGTV